MTGGSRGSGHAAVIPLLQELLRIDSTSGGPGERTLLLHLAGWLRERGVERAEVCDEPGGPFLIAESVPGARRALLLAAHADTVPAGDLTAWRHDPLGADQDGGFVYGRGSSDMKGGLAAAAGALVYASQRRVPLSLVVTSGEEVGCVGAHATLAEVRRLDPGAIIAPESTGGQVRLGHRGAVWLRVVTAGVAAHGAAPERGRSAIRAMAAVVDRIDQVPLRRHEALGSETINVGLISGGSAPNMVADRCEAVLDVRVVGADAEHVRAWLLAQRDVTEVEPRLNLAAVWTSPDHPWLRQLQLAGVDLGSESAPDRTVAYFTDLSMLRQAVRARTPVVVWGPGDPAVVHAANERVSVRSVLDAVEGYVTAAIATRTSVSG